MWYSAAGEDDLERRPPRGCIDFCLSRASERRRGKHRKRAATAVNYATVLRARVRVYVCVS